MTTLLTRANPLECRSISISRATPVDHAGVAEGFGGKIGIDCTHKWPGENGFSRDYPKLISMSPDVVAKIDSLWPKLGL